MREIAPLRTLALRAVGPAGCNPEITFGGQRDINSSEEEFERGINGKENSDSDGDVIPPLKRPFPPDKPTLTSRLLRSLRNVKRCHHPYTGAGRPNANDVDLSHPWILAIYPTRPSVRKNTPLRWDDTGSNEILTIENGNHAVECLQRFIDGLVESGRAGDNRLGVHYFHEWVFAVIGEEAMRTLLTNNNVMMNSPKKRRKLINEYSHLPLGSLSLHNFSLASHRTFRSMEMANVGVCLGTLDLTGVHGLTDSILSNIICSGSFHRIKRLSIKNCRKVTGKGLASLDNLTNLTAIDVGGCFNIHPNDVILLVQKHPGTEMGTFNEIYASGLGWTDVALETLVEETADHLSGLGVGFSPHLTAQGLIVSLGKVGKTLDRLAVPFCEGMDDAAVSALGKHLINLAVLDIRGTKVTTLTGMMDGRVSAGVFRSSFNDASRGDDSNTIRKQDNALIGHLFVLARYSGISKNSLDDTMRVHHDYAELLTCILDGGGTGEGIRR